jgi:hypothetical protein
MKQEIPGSGIDSGANAGIAGAAAAMPRPQPVDDDHVLLYCRCGHPLHPVRLEKHRGMMLERYSCPQRRWWNHLLHPNAWVTPRDDVPD